MSKNTARWQQLDLQHHLHPFTDSRQLRHEGGSRIITRAEGVYLYDSEGNRLLDGLAGLWNVAVGYGRPELVEAARRQMAQMPYYSTFLHTVTPPAVELAGLLAELTPPGLDRFFYSSSGSEANDTIVRMIRRYWQLEGKPQKRIIISREFAYHGSTFIGSSLGGMAAMHQQGGLLNEFVHILPPYWYMYGGDMSPEEFGQHAAQALEKKILELGPENVAAFYAEPVQGGGGVIVPPATYWPKVQEICRRYDLLLAADEVICGFGRTGNWFGCETYDIQPDFMTLAKAITSGYLPLSAAVVGRRVAERLIENGGLFAHGYTYSGHPVSCAVAIANLRIFKAERLVEYVRNEIGPYFQRRLREALSDHPLVGEVRGVGLVAAVEMVRDKLRRRHFDPPGRTGWRCFQHGMQVGLSMRPVRDCVALAPALIITAEQVEELIDKLRVCLDRTARDFGAM